ncbi:hypothetical protein GQ457_15G022940 [Hibiscus cannabinus]
MHQGDEPVDGQQHQPVGGNAGALARPRAIRDHLTPILDDLNPGIVAPEIQAAHFELKPVMFNMLNSIGQFGGSPHEDARAWLSGVPAGSLESWTDLCRSFLMRYNPPNMHTQLRNDIASFRQGDDESMYECWDRYKGLLRKCTNHGFQDWTQVVMFYNGVNAPTRMMLDASANGTLLDKSPVEAFEILDRIANNDYQFPTSRLGSGRRTSGKLELDANDSVSAQLSAITNLLKNLQKPSDVREAKALSCIHCEGNHHATDCPVMHEQASYLGNYNKNSNNPYSNTYNPGWRQHRIFHGTTKVELMQAVRIGSKTQMHHQVSKLICLGILSPKAMPQYLVAIQWKLRCKSLFLQLRQCYKSILHPLSIMGICYKLKEHYSKVTVHHYEP